MEVPGWALCALGWGSELGGQKGWLAPPACSREGLPARNQGNLRAFRWGSSWEAVAHSSCSSCVSAVSKAPRDPRGPQSTPVVSCRLGPWRISPRTPAPLSSPGQDGLPGAGHTALSETCAETRVC